MQRVRRAITSGDIGDPHAVTHSVLAADVTLGDVSRPRAGRFERPRLSLNDKGDETMMRYAWVVLFLTLAPSAVLAQYAPTGAPPAPAGEDGPRTAVNGLYLELGGAASVYSVNYERFVQDDISLRVGFGYISLSASDTTGGGEATVSLLTIPVTASFVGLRSGSHALELGAGAVIARVSGSVTDGSGSGAFGSASGAVGTAILGYRYAPLGGGFNFRLAYTPIFGKGGLFNWAGLSIGSVF